MNNDCKETKHRPTKCEMFHELQKYALHESIATVLHFDGTSSGWIQPLPY